MSLARHRFLLRGSVFVCLFVRVRYVAHLTTEYNNASLLNVYRLHFEPKDDRDLPVVC